MEFVQQSTQLKIDNQDNFYDSIKPKRHGVFFVSKFHVM